MTIQDRTSRSRSSIDENDADQMSTKCPESQFSKVSDSTPPTNQTSFTRGHDVNGHRSNKTENGKADFAMDPVAICGMSMRLPGGVSDAESFWELLYNGRSGQCEVPGDRYNVDSWYGPGKPGHVNSKSGYFLNHDLAAADSSFWSMSKKELEAMDPQQRLTLEIVYECLQTAGQDPKALRGKEIGVFMGMFEGDWLELDGRDTQNSHVYRFSGYGDYMSGNRVHYEFGFTGPRYRSKLTKRNALRLLQCHYQNGLLLVPYSLTLRLPGPVFRRV
jgi:hypothetical protein